MAKNTVIVSITSNIAGLKKGVDGAESALSGLGKVAGIAAAAVGAAAIGIGTKAVNAASVLEQNMGAMGAVFKDNTKQMETWASGAASSLGLAKSEYAGLATILGSQMKNMGVSSDELGTQTDSLIRMGADLAAQFGGSTSEAVEALSSLLRGERDPIERYGVSINEAALKSKMAEMGLDGLSGAAEKNAKLQATLALLTEQTADAQGAFARESDTLAGKQQRLNANFENVMATLGNLLLPAVADVTGAFGELLTKVSESQAFKDFSQTLGDIATEIANFVKDLMAGKNEVVNWITANKDWLGGLALVGGTILGVITAINLFKAVQLGLTAATYGTQGAMLVAGTAAKVYGGIMKLQSTWTAVVTAAQWAWNAAMVANPIGLLITAIAALVAGLIWFFTQTELGQQIWAEFCRFLEEAWTNIVNVATAIWTGLATFFSDLWNTVSGFFVDAWNNIINFLKPVFEFIAKLIKTYIDIWVNIFLVMAAIFKTIWDAVNKAIQFVWNAIVSFLTPIINKIASFIKDTFENVKRGWTIIWNAIKGAFETVWNAIVSFLTPIINTVSSIISGVLNTISSIWNNAWNAVSSFFSDTWNNLVNGARIMIDQFMGPINSIKDKIVGAVSGAGEWLVNAGTNIIRGLWNGISSMGDWIMDKIGGFMDGIVGWAKDVLGIQSPSRVFMAIGRFTGQGLAIGIEKTEGLVKKTVSNLADVASNAFDAELNTPVLQADARSFTTQRDAASGRGGDIYIELNTLNPTAETGRMILRSIEDYKKSGGRLA